MASHKGDRHSFRGPRPAALTTTIASLLCADPSHLEIIWKVGNQNEQVRSTLIQYLRECTVKIEKFFFT